MSVSMGLAETLLHYAQRCKRRFGMTETVKFDSLSPTRKSLVRLMQETGFGRLEGLVIRAGEPALDPPPRIIRTLKLGGDNRPRPEVAKRNFILKAQVVELFQCMDKMQNGVIAVIEVKHGLPFKMEIEENAA